MKHSNCYSLRKEGFSKGFSGLFCPEQRGMNRSKPKPRPAMEVVLEGCISAALAMIVALVLLHTIYG